jgi:hypothetical protein
MPVFVTKVYVECETIEQANQILTERINHDEEIDGIEYKIWFWDDGKELPGATPEVVNELIDSFRKINTENNYIIELAGND